MECQSEVLGWIAEPFRFFEYRGKHHLYDSLSTIFTKTITIRHNLSAGSGMRLFPFLRHLSGGGCAHKCHEDVNAGRKKLPNVKTKQEGTAFFEGCNGW